MNITLANDTTFQGNGTANFNFNGEINGTGSLIKIGTATLSLAGANTFTGTTTVLGGQLILQNQNALQSSTLFAGGTGTTGTLVFDSSVAGHAFTFGGLSGSSVLNLLDNTGNSVTLSVGANNQSTTYSGILCGPGSLTKVGSGTLTLTSPVGGPPVPITINGGAVQLGTANAAQYGTITVGVANGLSFGTGVGTFSVGGLSGNGCFALTDTGGNAITLQVGNTYTPVNTTYSGVLSGNGNLAVIGGSASTLSLAGANTFTGTTTVMGGQLILRNQNALQSSTLFAGGTGTTGTLVLDSSVAGNAFTFGGLSGSSNLSVFYDAGTSVTLSIGANNQSTTYSGILSGPAPFSLTKVGSGTLTLTSPVGGPPVPITINGGAVQLGTANAAQYGTITVGVANGLSFGTGVGTFSVGGLSGNGCFALTDTGGNAITLQVGNTYTPVNTTYSGVLSGNGNLAVIGGSASTLSLAGANTFTGTTTVMGGQLILRNQNALQSSTLFAGGTGTTGTLVLDSSVAGNAFTFGGLSGSSNLSVFYDAGTSVTLSIGANNQSTTYSGILSGPAPFSLTKVGSGTLTLTSPVGSPPITINGGAVQLGTANAAQYGTITVGVANGLSFGTGVGTFSVGGLSGYGGFALTDTGGNAITLQVGNTYTPVNTTYSGVLSGNGNLAVIGGSASTLSLAGANTFTGTTTVMGGQLILRNQNALQSSTLFAGGTGTTGTLVLDSSVAGNAFTFGGLSGSGNLSVFYDAGTSVTLSIGANNQSTTYSGILSGPAPFSLTKVGSGTLTLTSPVGGPPVPITINGGAVQLGTANAAQYGTITVGVANGLSFGTGVGTFSVGGLSGNGCFALTDTGGNAITLQVGNTYTPVNTTYSGVLSGNGNLAVIGGSASTLSLAGANTFTGTTTVMGGQLILRNQNALQSSTLFAGGTGTTGTLVLDSSVAGNAFTFGGLSGSSNLSVFYDAGTSVTLSIGANNQSTTYSGILSGPAPFSLTKVGSGTLTLTSPVGGPPVPITINGGAVQLGTANAAQYGTITVGVANGLSFGTGVGTFSVGGLSGNGCFALTDTGGNAITLQVGNTYTPVNTTYSGVLSGNGNLAVIGGSASTLSLAGANTFTGTTTVMGGQLILRNQNALQSSTLFAGGTGTTGTLVLDSSVAGNAFTFGGLSGSGNLSVFYDAGTSVTLSIGANNQSTTYSGILSGPAPFSLTKVGSGTLTLTSPVGGPPVPITINGGAVQLGTANAAQYGTITVGVANGLSFGTGVGTFSVGGLSGNGCFALTDTGGNAITLQVGNTYTPVNTTYSGVLSGNGNLAVIGGSASTLSLAGANTFTGTTTVMGGQLILRNQNALQSSTLFAGGTGTTGTLVLDSSVAGNAFTFGGLSGSSNLSVFYDAGTSVTLSIGANNQSTTYSGILSGPAPFSLTKVGSGTLTLTSPVGSPPITINGGAVQLGTANAAQYGTITVGVANGLSFGTGVGTFSVGGLSGYGGFALTDTGGNAITLQVGNTYTPVNTTYSGVLSGNGNLAVIGGSASTLSLAGANTFTGTTTVMGGQLILRNQNALQSSTLFAGGTGTTGTLVLDSSVAGNAFTFGGLSGSGNLSVFYDAGTSVTLSIGANNQSTTYSGILSGPAPFSLTKVGSGTLTLTSPVGGPPVPITINGGAVQLGTANAAQYGTITVGVANGLSFGTGVGTFSVGGLSGNGCFALTDTGGNAITLQVGNTYTPVNTTYSGVLSGNGNLAVIGGSASTLSLAGANTFTGTTTVMGGQLILRNQNALQSSTLFAGGTGTTGTLVLDSSVAGNAFTFGGLSGSSNLSVFYDAGTSVTLSIGANNQSTTYSGILSGPAPFSLTKVGSGTLTLAGANTYTDTTTVSAGTLNLANPLALGNGIFVGGAGALTFDPAVSTHAFTFGGLSGGTNVNLVDTAFNPIALSVGNNNQSTTYSGSVGGSGSFTKIGSGTLMLAGANTYSGTTMVSAGTLDLANSLALGNSTFVADGGGTLTFDASVSTHGFTFGGLSGGTNINLWDANFNPITLSLGNNNQSTTYSGSVGGSGSFTKIGSGTLTLAGANTYTGTTTVSAGTLDLANSLAIRSSTFVADGGGTLTFDASVSTHGFTLGGLSGSNANDFVYLADTAGNPIALSVGNNNQSTTYSGSFGGPGSLTKIGSGTLTLAGANTYTGTTTVSAGTLNLANPLALENSTFVGGAGALMFDPAVSTHAFTFGGLSGGTNTNLWDANHNPIVLSVGNNNQPTTYSGSLGRSGSFTKIGSGTLTLAGANTYTGTTTVSAGTLDLANSLAIRSSTFVADGGGTLTFDASVSTHAFTFGGLGGANPNDFVYLANNTAGTAPNSITLSVGFNNQSATYSGILGGPGSLTKIGSGTLTLAGANTYTGTTTVSAGTLNLANPLALENSTFVGGAGALMFDPAVSTHAFTFGGLSGGTNVNLVDTAFNPIALSVGNNNQSTTYSGSVGGSGSFTKIGSGTLMLAGANTYSGTTMVSAGTLDLANSLARGNSTFVADGGGTLTFDASVSTHGFTFGGLSGANPNDFVYLADTAGNPIALSVGNNNQSTTYSGSLGSPFWPGFLVKIGSGTLTLAGANTYTGYTMVNAGTLNLANPLALGNSTFVGGAGALMFDPAVSTHAFTFGGLSGGTNVNLWDTYHNPIALSVGNNNQSTTYSGSLGGPGSLTKVGSGTLNLSGENTYAGLTTVAGGTLELGPSAQNCVFNFGGANIQSGAIVFDYYTNGGDPIVTILSLLKASYDGGRWDVGQFRDSTALATGLTLGCFDNTATDQVTVMATYPGDFNLDGVVDSQDKAIWFAHAFTGTTWQQGDANYDGAVDGLDRDLMLAYMGLPPIAGMPGATGVAPVPEPSALALSAVAFLGFLAYAQRCRKCGT